MNPLSSWDFSELTLFHCSLFMISMQRGGNKTRWLDAPAALGFLKKSSHSHISDRPASTPIIYETERDWEAQPDNRVWMRLGRGRLCKTNAGVVSGYLVMVQVTFQWTKEKNVLISCHQMSFTKDNSLNTVKLPYQSLCMPQRHESRGRLIRLICFVVLLLSLILSHPGIFGHYIITAWNPGVLCGF